MSRRSQYEVNVATVRQPMTGQLADALCAALVDARYTELRAAVAYVTTSGVQQLAGAVSESRLTMKWLSAFDWCRSEPVALAALDSAKHSAVRVHAGGAVVERAGCVPRTPFHPKSFLFTGPESALLVSGSGNLSASGLRRGVELGTVIAVGKPSAGIQGSPWQAVSEVGSWFNALWGSADRYKTLADRYEDQFAKRASTSADLDFGDAPEPGAGRFTAEQLAQVAHASTMWIDAGRLTARTSVTPGHQLMMRPYTRVFFGIVSARVPQKTHLDDVLIAFGGAGPVWRSLEFAHNSMDRLNLPTSDGTDPARYDGQTLVFTKRPNPGRVVYELALVADSKRAKLKTASQRRGLAFKMSGPGREFGFI